VLSNSFGFGGNNASVILAKPAGAVQAAPTQALPALRIASMACLTGQGGFDEMLVALRAGQPVAGLVPDAAFSKAAPAAFIRRLKRLPRLMLALANTAHGAAGLGGAPDLLAVGTAWGPLAETQEFLRKLFESNDQFSSPMDFIGSVNNAPAGQVALLLDAQSPNLTFSSGTRSFEQALLAATLGIAGGARNALVLAAEAFEPKLSPLLDPAAAAQPCDGGAAFCVVADDGLPGARVRWLGEAATCEALCSTIEARDRFDAILLGAPPALDEASVRATMATAFPGRPIVSCGTHLGRHASIGATALAVAAHAVLDGALPLTSPELPLSRKRLLLLQVGARSTALEVFA
jgi:hypothetical protein